MPAVGVLGQAPKRPEVCVRPSPGRPPRRPLVAFGYHTGSENGENPHRRANSVAGFARDHSGSYRGLRHTRASLAAVAELSFPATATLLHWIFLGARISIVQLVGFALLWGVILHLEKRNP